MDCRPTEEEIEKLQIHQDEERNRNHYFPRPRWQVVMAWVLMLIVVLAVINLCYWQIRG